MHVLQSRAWQAVRVSQGHEARELGKVSLLIKRYPGKLGGMGSITMANTMDIDWHELTELATKEKLSHVLVEPLNYKSDKIDNLSRSVMQPTKSIMMRDTILINLTKSDEDLLAGMKKNTRYNIKYSEKQGVSVEVRTDDEALEIFLRLFAVTLENKSFFGRNADYYRQVWAIMREHQAAVIAIASYQGEPLVARFLFLHEDTIYTAYTGFSRAHPKVKAAYMAVWGVIQWGKVNGYKHLNMWGIVPDAKESDPDYGYSQFKMGFGGEVVSYADSFDFVASPFRYRLFLWGNKLRWWVLRLKKKLK